MPKDLTLAHQLGQCGCLEPSGTFECKVTAELSRADDRPVANRS
jgi:hypothetical protein